MATIDDVNAEAQGNKLKALQAMAAGKSDPYNAGQQQVRDSQSEALGSLATSAAQGLAPAGVADELRPTVAGPGDAALAALATGGAPYSADLSAISATGVAKPTLGSISSASAGAVGKPYPVQTYGPYVRYGGFGSQGELDDAVLADARHRATADAGHWGQQAGAAEKIVSDSGNEQIAGAHAKFGSMQPQPKTFLGVKIPQSTPVSPDRVSLLGHTLYERPSAETLGAAREPIIAGLAHGLRGSEQAALDPVGLYKYAQQSAVDHGAVPMYAEGHYSPEWAMDLALKDLAGPNDYAQQQNEYQQRSVNPGGYSDEELRQQAAINDALNTAAIKGSAEYQAGANFIDGALQGVGQGAKPPTLDETRVALAKLGLPSDVIAQLVKDYGGLFPTAGFVNNLPVG